MVEVLIVIALMALLGGAIVGGGGMLGGTRLRSGATLVMGSVRAAVNRANTTGLPVRLVFDLDNHRVMLQETRGRMLRVTGHDEGAKAGAEAATELEREAAEYARSFDGPRAPPAMFTPVAEFDRGGDPDSTGGRELGRGIKFIQVQTEHDTEPRVSGQAYLYFWPGGGTEQAAIQIGRDGDPDGLTVLVNALTGRARLQRGRIQLEEARRDSYFDEREEP